MRSPKTPSCRHRFALLATLLSITAVLAALGCARAHSRAGDDLAIGLAVGIALTPTVDVVAWTVDAQGNATSTWIKGTSVENEIVAKRPGIVIPAGVELWQWQATAIDVPLCDCEAWEADGREGECPAADDTGQGQRVELVELVSGNRLELVAEPTGTGDEGGPIYTDFSAGAAPIASVGPYLFYRRDEGGTECGTAHGSWWSEFKIIDLERREEVELFGAEERARIAAAEQHTAFELMADDKLVEASSAEDLKLTLIEPEWSQAGLAIRYQFTADASYVDSDENWGAYARSVSVRAGSIPAALAAYVAIPAPLQSFTFPSGDQGRVGGFGLVLGAQEQITALVTAFSAGDQTDQSGPERQ